MKTKWKFMMIGMIIILILGLSGCSETNKSIFIGEFKSMEDCDKNSDTATGKFLKIDNEIETIYISGNWEYIELNRLMKISVEYYLGYNLLDYDYIEV
jgi:hypothetical protein